MEARVAVARAGGAREGSEWTADVRAITEGLVDLVVLRSVTAGVRCEVERAAEGFHLRESERKDGGTRCSAEPRQAEQQQEWSEDGLHFDVEGIGVSVGTAGS